MKLANDFDVPARVEDAWPILLDLAQISPCLPGAVIDGVDGDRYSGRIKIKAGPITVNYVGELSVTDVDESERRVVLHAEGKESRGSGTVKATVTARLAPSGVGSHVDVETDLAITGKPAQLGRGLIAEVGGAIVDQFARNLAAQLSGPSTGGDAAGPDGPAVHTGPPANPVDQDDASLDLLPLLAPYLRRAGLVLAAVAAVGLVARGLFGRRGAR